MTTFSSTSSSEPSADPIQFVATPRWQDLARVQTAMIHRQAKMLMPFAALALIVFAVSPWLSASASPTSSIAKQYWERKVVLILPGILFVFVPAATVIASIASYRSYKRSAEWNETRTWRFDEQGVHYHAPSSNGMIHWSLVSEALVVGSCLVLIRHQNAADVVPLRKQDDVVRNRVLQMVAANVPKVRWSRTDA